MTTTPDNPFAAVQVGALYARGRPYHHPRSLARLRALLAGGNADADVERALDVACGTGMSTVALADFADMVVGLDISAAKSAPGVIAILTRENTPRFKPYPDQSTKKGAPGEQRVARRVLH